MKKKYLRHIVKTAMLFWRIDLYWENVPNAERIPGEINAMPAEPFSNRKPWRNRFAPCAKSLSILKIQSICLSPLQSCRPSWKH